MHSAAAVAAGQDRHRRVEGVDGTHRRQTVPFEVVQQLAVGCAVEFDLEKPEKKPSLTTRSSVCIGPNFGRLNVLSFVIK